MELANWIDLHARLAITQLHHGKKKSNNAYPLASPPHPPHDYRRHCNWQQWNGKPEERTMVSGSGQAYIYIHRTRRYKGAYAFSSLTSLNSPEEGSQGTARGGDTRQPNKQTSCLPSFELHVSVSSWPGLSSFNAPRKERQERT